VTLAQVFWLKDMEGQPAKLFVVSDGALSIAEHFANFGTDIADLRKRLRRTPKTEIFDAFPPTRRLFVGASASRTTRRWIYSTRRVHEVSRHLTDFVRTHVGSLPSRRAHREAGAALR